MQALNWADYVILAIIVISTLISLIRGFVREVLSLATWVAAFIVAFLFSSKLSTVFTSFIHSQAVRLTISFAIVFIITLILGDLLSYLVSKLASKKGLSGIDRTLGMLFGFVRGILIIAVLLLLVAMGSPEHALWWQQSYLIPHFQGLVDWLHNFLPQQMHHLSNAAANGATTTSTSAPSIPSGSVISPEVAN